MTVETTITLFGRVFVFQFGMGAGKIEAGDDESDNECSCHAAEVVELSSDTRIIGFQPNVWDDDEPDEGVY